MILKDSELLQPEFLHSVRHIYDAWERQGVPADQVQADWEVALKIICDVVTRNLEDYDQMFRVMYDSEESLAEFNYGGVTYPGFPWELAEVICLANAFGYKSMCEKSFRAPACGDFHRALSGSQAVFPSRYGLFAFRARRSRRGACDSKLLFTHALRRRKAFSTSLPFRRPARRRRSVRR